MSPYLATVTLGRFDLTEYEIDGIPTYVAVDPQLSKGSVLGKLPAIVRFFSGLYGPYPFNAAGAIVDDAPGVGYALETQTKPNFDVMPSDWTLVHETAHMWYGDSVTLKDWPDIWLNEGFATWSNWMWSETQGNKTAHSQFKAYYSSESALALDRADGRPGRGAHVRLGASLPARRHDPAGAAREDRRRGFFDMMSDLGGGATATVGHDGAVRRPGRGEERHGAGRLLPGLALRAAGRPRGDRRSRWRPSLTGGVRGWSRRR